MIDPGRLNRRLTLQAPIESDDGQGGVVRGYADQAAVWAQVAPVVASAVERGVAGAEVAAMQLRIILRAGVTLTRTHRFVDGANIYRIVAWRDRDGGRLVEIDAEIEQH